MKTSIKIIIIICVILSTIGIGLYKYLTFIPFDINDFDIPESVLCDDILIFESVKSKSFCQDDASLLNYHVSIYQNKTLIDTAILKIGCKEIYEDYGVSNEVDNFYKGQFDIIGEDFKLKFIYFDKLVIIVKANNDTWEYFLNEEISEIIKKIGV